MFDKCGLAYARWSFECDGVRHISSCPPLRQHGEDFAFGVVVPGDSLVHRAFGGSEKVAHGFIERWVRALLAKWKSEGRSHERCVFVALVVSNEGEYVALEAVWDAASDQFHAQGLVVGDVFASRQKGEDASSLPLLEFLDV